MASARRAWRRMEPRGSWEPQYREDVGPKLTALVVAAQVAATREADRYMAEVLNELNFGPPTEPGVVAPMSLAGWAGDGRPVSSLLEQSVAHAGRAYNAARTATPETVLSRTPPESAAEDALAEAERWMAMVTQTIIADTARAAEAVAMARRPWVEGYVRMLNPPSCSRCVVLAGRFYLYNAGFDRHERCDCVHVPAQEADYGDLRVNPGRYFESLSRAEQDRAFTKAGAESIRLGADISQVVNARRGMRTAQQNPGGWIPKGRMVPSQIFGRDVLTTTEGVTKSGVFGKINKDRRAAGLPALPVRLMPESILAIAGSNRDEAIRLLRLYGYLT